MKTVSQLLDAIKEKHGLKSDYKLSLFTGIREQSLSNYRNERTYPDASTCIKIAELLDMDAALLVVEMEARRTKDEGTRAIWQNLSRRLQMGIANVSLMLAVAIVLIAAASPAARAAAEEVVGPSGSLYIMLSSVGRVIYSLITLIVKMCKAGRYVPRHTDTAPKNPA